MIPEGDPGAGGWEIVEVSRQSEEEGVAAGDMDGDLDLASIAWRQYRYLRVWLDYIGE